MTDFKIRKLPIVFAADTNFSIPFGLAVFSLLESASATTYYDIYVLDDGITDEIKRDVEKLKGRFNFSITYFIVSETIKGLPSTTVFPPVSYARFMIPDLLPEHITERVFYIDSDVIFLDDLTPLYDMDMEGKPVAATQGLNMTAVDNRHYLQWLGKEYGMDFYEPGLPYFHSGEMLFDLQTWKLGNYSRKCLDLAEGKVPKRLLYYDQDFFNVACRGQIANFPARYCVIPRFEHRYYGDYKKMYEGLSLYSEEELHSALASPAILHYAGPKPIVFDKPRFAGESAFFELWKRSPWKKRIPYFPRLVLLMKPSPARLQLLKQTGRMNLKNTISVIIHTHNLVTNGLANSFIRNVHALHEQDYENIEILVADSDSADGTLDLLHKYEEIGILRPIKNCPTNKYDAYNDVIRQAQGDYILFLKANDFLPDKSCISTLISQLNRELADLVCGISEIRNTDDELISSIYPTRKPFAYSSPGSLSATIFRAESLRMAGGFQATTYPECADYALFLSINRQDRKIAKSKAIVHEYSAASANNLSIYTSLQDFIEALPQSGGGREIAKPCVSVIMAAGSNIQHVQITLSALQRQSLQSIEFIIVDDQSNKEVTEKIMRLQTRDKRFVHLLNESSQGICRSFNRGMNAASGDYICFIRPGDIPEANWLQLLYQRASVGKYILVKSPSYVLYPTSPHSKMYTSLSDLQSKAEKYTNLLCLHTEISGPALYSREILQKNHIQFADFASCTDESFFLLQVAAHTPTWRVAVITDAAYLHVKSDGPTQPIEQIKQIQQLSVNYLLSLPPDTNTVKGLNLFFEHALSITLNQVTSSAASLDSLLDYLSHIAQLLNKWKSSVIPYEPGISVRQYEDANLNSLAFLNLRILPHKESEVRVEAPNYSASRNNLYDMLTLQYCYSVLIRKKRLLKLKYLFSWGKRRKRYKTKLNQIKSIIQACRNNYGSLHEINKNALA